MELVPFYQTAPAVAPPFLAREQGVARYALTAPTSAYGNAPSRGREPGGIGLMEPLTFQSAAHAAVRPILAKGRGDACHAALAHLSASAPNEDTLTRSP